MLHAGVQDKLTPMREDQQDELRRFIRERLREMRFSESSVSTQLGRHRGYLHEFLAGKQKHLPLEERFKLADILKADPTHLGAGREHAPKGFAESDMTLYEAQADDPFAALTGQNRYLWTVETDVCDNIGIRRGHVLVVDDSQVAVDALRPLQPVQVAYHPPGEPDRAVRLLRQFVPPRLLITNSSKMNLPSLDIERDDAQIVGVIESMHAALGSPRA